MPASKTAKRNEQGEPARGGTATRQPQRGGRKRARVATTTTDASAETVEPSVSPASNGTALAEGGQLEENASLFLSLSAAPAGRSSAHEPVSATTTSSSGVDEDEAPEENGLVRSNASSFVQSSDDAGNVNDGEAVAKLRNDVCSAAEKIRRNVEISISRFTMMDSELEGLAAARQAVQPKVNEVVQSRFPEQYAEVVTLNVGGDIFTVPLTTLLSKDSPNYFHVLLGSDETDGVTPVFKDERHAIFIDRDPVCFKHILSYFRGYQYFNLLKEDTVRRLKIDAAYFQLPGLLAMLGETEPEAQLQFNAGPGVSMERNRLRVVYGVAMVGDVFLVTGRHAITYEVKIADYTGFGLVSEACVCTDQEFHKTADSCVYYMSGVFYTNYPYHRKEENLDRIENGDFLTMKVDLDKGYVEYVLKNSRKMISIGRARRLRFATTMKLASRVRIVPPEEVIRRLPPVHYTFDE
ncbi:hypothetical protein ABB37_00485 [Leptomonas pyrrhocoris]|uniref:BTB domain-containing protein n=1 Tax=Leptomonas pyrrhocoris TaxID=157538 RepID=A0A0N0E0B4_LEPPY|nr:hypothetical protein ABB37_00485 [Leptomonas pyrrhocoris]XP_015664694.1 hypothetical protein ABB37_00485 [Leptomonas pyrrhocoris]KPA86254.1 hypothetical protein ABB37_00485 [Leptomonas pyrrhocoris]KPA86255.1 hypothetical protein ABB37_00485 [Leptomonas pyrrhocoris]|eukprot:XP_015664693.1 hypothetical protein ABB37_00485 [Leptomonas pyrrhocoris]